MTDDRTFQRESYIYMLRSEAFADIPAYDWRFENIDINSFFVFFPDKTVFLFVKCRFYFVYGDQRVIVCVFLSYLLQEL